MTFNGLLKIVADAKATGADIDAWVRAKSIIAVAGAVGEAKFTGQDAADVWQSYACEDDVRDFQRDCKLGGFDQDAVLTCMLNAIETVET